MIGSVRNPDSTTLQDFKPAEGSRLLLVKIESASEADPSAAVEELKAAGVTLIDIVIANAGINPSSAFAFTADIQTEDLRRLFEVNTFSFVALFRAVQPLLHTASKQRKSSAPKLLAISSTASQLVDAVPAPVVSYGASKAALNFLVRHVHLENPWLTAWVMNPGFVQTDNGFEAARAAGMDKPPQTIEESIIGLVKMIDHATRDETSGNFYSYDGDLMHY